MLRPLLHAREGGDHGEQRCSHEGAAHVLHLFYPELSFGEVSDHLCGSEDPGGPLIGGGEDTGWRSRCHALVARADDEVCPDLFAVHGLNANGVSPVIKEGNVVLPGNLGYAVDVVFIGKLIVKVVDHDEFWQLLRLLPDSLDLQGYRLGCDQVVIIEGHLFDNASGHLDRQELCIMGERRNDHAVSLLQERLGDSLKAPAGSRHNSGLIHVEEFGQVLVELLYGWPGDLIQPEGLSAVIAGGVAVAVGYDGLSCFRRKPSCCLDGMDVYELLFPCSGI